ncbi:molybdopterin-dependent oxidoreductase [Shimia sp. R9_2]|uniref:molybdopterin-dependent oxidoreductase n=1 Tax=Shimia sp. R9_2 TaxID=2821112 RepID=UPI001ADB28F8|nr:molybdopterin-dependent oxidoreductase [Shimia sp. R9_2]
MFRNLNFALLSFVFLIAAIGEGRAEPQGATILTVTGDLSHGEQVTFDRDQLKEIGWETITTESPFLEGEQTFTGTPMSALLRYLDIETGTFVAFALNDYSIEIPLSDARKYQVLLALEHNGQAMRVRDRGPIWIIYPTTKSDSLDVNAERRMVWQLKQLDYTR